MLSIEYNIADLERSLSDLARRQLPFAMALTLNDVATDAKEAEEAEVERTLDRPTPFTKRGLYLQRASKSRLSSEIGFKRVQAEYLKLQVTGGTRRPKSQALVMPVGQRTNKYGNMPKGAVRRFSGGAKTFVAGRGRARSKGLAPGIYKRTGRGGKKIKLMVAFRGRASYSKRLDFEQVALRRGQSVAPAHFVRRLQQAIASAR